MFYCNPCGQARSWPTSTQVTSIGNCEICGKGGSCNDVPSSQLPDPRPPSITVHVASTDTDNGTGLFASIDDEAVTTWLINQFIEDDGRQKFDAFIAAGGADLSDFLEPHLGIDSWSKESFELELPPQLPMKGGA